LNDTALTFLRTLSRLAEPQSNGSVSMYAVGAQMDLDREASSQIAQELMGDGLVEVRTLAGDIAITPDGLALLQSEMETVAGDDVRLGKNGVASSDIKTVLQDIVNDLEEGARKWNLNSDDHAEFRADLSTLKAQLTSPQPKNAILRATVESHYTLLNNLCPDEPVNNRLACLLG
jgi:hypothetical protein